MHEERDSLWHFVMSIEKYRESQYVTVLYANFDVFCHSKIGAFALIFLRPKHQNLHSPFRAAKTSKFARKPRGNACYAGYFDYYQFVREQT